MPVKFYFAGPSKTASTWIYQALAEHPSFSLPKAKDIYFFDQFYEKGTDWYHQQFKDCHQDKIIGDFSHDYLMNPQALQRIKDYNPDARILACIRNPFERTESGVRFLQRNGYGFGNIEELTRKHVELIEGSLYGRNIERLYQIFDREQVLLLDYRQLQDQPAEFLQNIYRFLDVPDFTPSILDEVVNKAKAARSPLVALLVKRAALFSRRIGLGNLVGMLKMNPTVNRLLYKESGISFRLKDEDRAFLASHFNGDIDKLCALTGVDYSAWKH